jgi:integrase
VFLNPSTGNPWVGDGQIRKTAWKPALHRASVRYRYPYQTRHTFASMLLTASENPAWMAKQMGHKDWGMIRRVYARWLPDSISGAGSKAGQLLSA